MLTRLIRTLVLTLKCVALVSIITCGMHAQQQEGFDIRFQMGVARAGYTGNVNACDISTPKGNVLCPPFTDYSGVSVSAAVGLDYAITQKLHAGVDFGIISANGSTEVPGESSTVTVKGTERSISTSFKGTAKSFDAFPRIYLSFYLPANFFLEVGAGALVNISNNVTSIVNLSTPGLVYFDSISTIPTVFRNDNRAVLLYTDTLSSFEALRTFLDVSVGQSYVIGGLTLQIVARYQLPLHQTDLQTLSLSNLGGNLVLMQEL